MASHATISAYRGGLEDWPSVARLAAQNKAIEGLAPYVEGEGMVKVGTDLSGTMLRGVLPEEENKVSDIDAHIKAGSFDSLKAGTYNIVIGNELANRNRSEEHTSELQSLMRISYAVFCLNKKT